MTWALRGAELLASLVALRGTPFDAAAALMYEAQWAREIGRAQQRCLFLARSLERRDVLMHAALAFTRAAPRTASAAARRWLVT